MASITQQDQTRRTGFGIIVIIGSVFLMAVQDALIKYASSDLALSQIFVLRSILVLAMLSAVVRGTLAGTWRNAIAPWPMIRAVALTLMYASLYAAIPYVPLATLAAAFYTGPLFIVLLSAAFLSEPVNPRGWLAVMIGFAGVVVLLDPGEDAFSPLTLIPVLSGFCYASAAVLTRGKCRRCPPVAMALALNVTLFGAGVLLASAIPLFEILGLGNGGGSFLLADWTSPTAADWQLIAILTVLMVGIGLGLACAYQIASPVVIASFDYSYLLFSTSLGIVFFAEVPDLPTLLGMALIAGAGFLALEMKPGK